MNLPWSSNHLHEAIVQASDKFGWQKRTAGIGSMRDGHEIVGYGMPRAIGRRTARPAEARVELKSDGTASIFCAVQDIGTGTYTIAAQTVSSMTGLPVERIDVKLGDSSFPDAPLSGGSWATASVMPAIAAATRNAIAQLKVFATQNNAYFDGVKPTACASKTAGS